MRLVFEHSRVSESYSLFDGIKTAVFSNMCLCFHIH